MWTRTRAIGLALALIAGSSTHADEVLFNNGDRLTGKILSVDDGKMTIDSKLAGEVKVDMKNVKTFTTDAPIEIRTKDGQRVTSKAAAGEPGTVRVASGTTLTAAPKSVAMENMKYVNFSEA